MSDDHCKDCQTPSACGHYAECLRTTIQRPAGDTRCKDCPGPAFGLCCRPAGDATPLPADEVLEKAQEALETARQTIVDLRTVLDPFDHPAKVIWAASAHRLSEIDAALRSLRGNKT